VVRGLKAARSRRPAPHEAPRVSDKQVGTLRGTTEAAIREQRWSLGIHPAYKTVDTCAGEFPSSTPYLYSSYDDENESQPLGERGIVILAAARTGSGRAWSSTTVAFEPGSRSGSSGSKRS